VKPKNKRNQGLDSSATEKTPAVSRQKKKKKIQSSSESEVCFNLPKQNFIKNLIQASF
jgi:hypothetical protein